MSLTQIPNQPVNFDSNVNDATCGCHTYDFQQIVIAGDTTPFEITLSETSGTTLVTAGDFSTACGVDWTCGANWGIAAGVASKTAGAGNSITQPLGIGPDKYYKVVYTIDSISGGTLSVTIGGIAVDSQTAAGTYTAYGQLSAAPANLNIDFGGDAGCVCVIDDIIVTEMSTAGYTIADCSTGAIAVDNCKGTTTTYNGTKALVKPDWTGIADGCYKICVQDSSKIETSLIPDGGFANPCGIAWTCGGSWNIAGGAATVTAGAGNSDLSQFVVATDLTQCYMIQVEITAYTSGALQVIIFNPGLTVVASLNTVGVHNVYLTSAFAIGFLTFRGDNTTTLTIDNVRVGSLTGLCSQCYSTTDSTCTIPVTWTNDEDAFGFDYEVLSFTQFLRLEGRLRFPSYPRNKETYTDSAGAETILYSRQSKLREFVVREIPEYLHDALSVGLEHDTLTIDGNNYVYSEDSYDPDWRKSSDKAPIILEVRETPQDLVNSNC